MPAFRGTFDQWVRIIMAPADYFRSLVRFRYSLYHVLDFIVNRVHSMAIGFNLFFLTTRSCIYQVLYVPKIKMTGKQNFIAIKKIIALYVQEALKKRNPDRIC